MGELISYEEREVRAKGLNKKALPQEPKIKKYIFSEEYNHLKWLDQLPKFSLTNTPSLFYPGCGSDVLFPLIYLEKLFPKIKEVNFIFVDQEDELGMIKTILDDIGISFKEKKKKLHFYWKDLLVHLEFIHDNVFRVIDHLAGFEIYFDKVFRIMREQDPSFEKKVFDKLKKGGVLIADSGFQSFPLKRIAVPKELSTYEEMVIGVKD